MFTKQFGQIKQKFDSFIPGLGTALANMLGNCEQSLEHGGPVSLNGPFTSTGDSTFGSSSQPTGSSATFNQPVTLNQPTTVNSTSAFNQAVTFNSTITLSTGYAAAAFVTGTIGTALGRDGTATLTISGGTVTVHGFFVPTSFQIPSGARVGAVYETLNSRWTAVVTDQCLEAA